MRNATLVPSGDHFGSSCGPRPAGQERLPAAVRADDADVEILGGATREGDAYAVRRPFHGGPSGGDLHGTAPVEADDGQGLV